MSERSRTQLAIDQGYATGPAPAYLLELEAELDAASQLYDRVTQAQVERLFAGAGAGYQAACDEDLTVELPQLLTLLAAHGNFLLANMNWSVAFSAWLTSARGNRHVGKIAAAIGLTRFRIRWGSG